MARKKTEPTPTPEKGKDPLQDQKVVSLKACALALNTTKYLEEQIKAMIRDGKLNYADLLSVKSILDCNLLAVSELQEIDVRIRRLISMEEWEMGKMSNAFLDKTIVVTD